MVQADSKEEFKDAWQSHINQIYKLGHSLPEDELDEFMDEVGDVEDFIDRAAENTFDE